MCSVLQTETEENGQTKRERKVYDLDSNLDSFWRANAGLPFPQIAGTERESETKRNKEKR
jgi:hypothetical protein